MICETLEVSLYPRPKIQKFDLDPENMQVMPTRNKTEN